ncbi:hypothetical protein (Partial), partial [Seminavis robusta]
SLEEAQEEMISMVFAAGRATEEFDCARIRFLFSVHPSLTGVRDEILAVFIILESDDWKEGVDAFLWLLIQKYPTLVEHMFDHTLVIKVLSIPTVSHEVLTAIIEFRLSASCLQWIGWEEMPLLYYAARDVRVSLSSLKCVGDMDPSMAFDSHVSGDLMPIRSVLRRLCRPDESEHKFRDSDMAKLHYLLKLCPESAFMDQRSDCTALEWAYANGASLDVLRAISDVHDQCDFSDEICAPPYAYVTDRIELKNSILTRAKLAAMKGCLLNHPKLKLMCGPMDWDVDGVFASQELLNQRTHPLDLGIRIPEPGCLLQDGQAHGDAPVFVADALLGQLDYVHSLQLHFPESKSCHSTVLQFLERGLQKNVSITDLSLIYLCVDEDCWSSLYNIMAKTRIMKFYLHIRERLDPAPDCSILPANNNRLHTFKYADNDRNSGYADLSSMLALVSRLPELHQISWRSPIDVSGWILERIEAGRLKELHYESSRLLNMKTLTEALRVQSSLEVLHLEPTTEKETYTKADCRVLAKHLERENFSLTKAKVLPWHADGAEKDAMYVEHFTALNALGRKTLT